MKKIFGAVLAGSIIFNTNLLLAESISSSSAASNSWTVRGANYELEEQTLKITENSLKMIDRVDNGDHAKKILSREIPALSIRSGTEKIYSLHNLFEEGNVSLSPKEDLLIEFEGNISKLEMEHICNGRDGKYFALSAPEIYYAQNYSLKISTGEATIRELIIETEPSEGLMLEKDVLDGHFSHYWRFFINHTNYGGKLKILGLVNYAEQTLDKNSIERLRLTITVIKITPL